MTRPSAPAATPGAPAVPGPPTGPGMPAVPADVQRFAEEVGAAPYLPSVLAMTRRVYPQGPLSILLVEDPEIENYVHIAFEVDVTGWDSQQVSDLLTRWSSEIAGHCPSTHTPYFLMRLR